MPVLGATDNGPILKPGISIPVGSLDRWRAARNNAANQLVEVPIFGDSTTNGQAIIGAAKSWVTTLRTLSRAVFPDGGRGIFGFDDTAAGSNESLSGILSLSGWGAYPSGGGQPSDFFNGNSFRSSAGADSVTFQGYGTQCRLHYTFRGDTGDFTYSIDGGAPVTVLGFGLSNTLEIKPLLLALGAYGLHTVTITNLGGIVVAPPVITTVGLSGTGGSGLAPLTTYRYVLTSVTANGETAASAVGSSTTNVLTTCTNRIDATRAPGAVTYNLYRATGTSGGTFDLLATGIVSTSNFGIQTIYTDDGTVTPNAAIHPPSSGTAGRAGPKEIRIVPEFMRATGIVYHQMGVSGIATGGFFSPSTSDPNVNNWNGAVALGIAPGSPPAYGDTTVQWSNAQGAHPQFRHPPLAICFLGGNDQGGQTTQGGIDTITTGLRHNIGEFIRLCRAAQCDPLVLVPHLEYFPMRQLSSQTRDAVWGTAVAMGAAVADMNVALGPYNVGRTLYTPGPHLNQAGYDQFANWLWTNVLSL